jgi:hypothetical protein
MFHKIRARISSAHVMAGLAIFIVLGGSAFAAATIGSKQIKKNAVKTSKIANNAVKHSKIGPDAVTGDKVNESTLGKVPAATTADSATSATTATSADDADSFAGRELQQVRSLADGDSDSVTNGLPNGSFEEVITEDMGIPTGGADVIVNASIELENNSGAQAGGACELRDESSDMSNSYNVTIPPGFTTNVSLTAFRNYPNGTGALDPEDISVFCQGSGAANDVRFMGGDIAVQRVPDGV